MSNEDKTLGSSVPPDYENGLIHEDNDTLEAADEAKNGTTEGGRSQHNGTYPPHVWNPAISKLWRYGIPVLIVANTAFLLVSQISSGVVAKTQIIDLEKNSIFKETELMTVSIISSVSALWNADSQVLAIFIALTSVMLPYLKLLLSLVAWILPIRKIERRELFLECVDIMGKWSFVDIFVLILIMVAFRETIEIADVVALEIYVLPKWGFYAFVAANMMSLVLSQTILYLHRHVQYHTSTNTCTNSSTSGSAPETAVHLTQSQGDADKGAAKPPEIGVEDAPEQDQMETIPDQPVSQDSQHNGDQKNKVAISSQTGLSVPFLLVVLVCCLTFHFVGCSINIYQVSTSRGKSVEVDKYSVFSIGTKIPGTVPDPNDFGIRFIQFMYFLIAAALPAWNLILVGIVYMIPMTQLIKENVFFLAEITFSWAAGEVLVLAIVFSVLQIPNFGNKLIQSGCRECNSVDSLLYGEFAVLCVSVALSIVVLVYLFRRAHKVIW